MAPVHGIFQARILEWAIIFFCGGPFQPRDQTRVSCTSCTGSWIFFTTAPPGKPEGTKAEPQLFSVFPTEEQNCSFTSDLVSQVNKKCVYFTLGQNVYNSSREYWQSHGQDGP